MLKSLNAAVDQYKVYLGDIHAAPAPLPPPSQKDAAAAQDTAAKLNSDAEKSVKLADNAPAGAQKTKRERAAKNVQAAADKADVAAQRTTAKVDEAKTTGAPPTPAVGALPLDTPIKPPAPPKLPDLDLDTGKSVHAGEYLLADETYAELLNDLVKPEAPAALVKAVDKQHAKAAEVSDKPLAAPAPKPVAPARLIAASLAKNIEEFFAHPETPKKPALSKKKEAAVVKLKAQVEANLVKLKAMTAPEALTASFGPARAQVKGF